MKTFPRLTALAATLFMAAVASAESTATLTEMHLCCGACVNAVRKAAQSVDGVTVVIDKSALSAKVTGANNESVQKALDAIAAAGFHGKSSSESLKIKDNSGVKAGNAKRLALLGVHNCCGGCNVAIKKALKSVPGVDADTAKPKSNRLVVEGEFDGLAVVKALNLAGFHVVADKK